MRTLHPGPYMSPAKAVNRWRLQLIGIYNRGADAKRAGLPRAACPYKIGSGVQRQRRSYWFQGWDSTTDDTTDSAKSAAPGADDPSRQP